MEFKSISHFRELGGYKTQDGKTIKHGLLYRSGELARVSEEELTILNSLGIDTVFDLRSVQESLAKPDVKGSYRIVSCPLANPEREVEEKYKNPLTRLDKLRCAEEKNYNYHIYSSAKLYMEFPYNKGTIAKIIRALNDHEAILFHCAGGKDRTGTIAMLIMLFLGCDYETCKRDYLLHNEISKEEVALYIRKLEQQQLSDWGMKMATSSCQAWDFLFDCAYMSIFDTYKSIEAYLEDQFGITPEQIRDWRQFYLE